MKNSEIKYFIKTFGCAQNIADSERLEGYLEARGMKKAKGIKEADHVVINTCMIRQTAEDRVYGWVHNLGLSKIKTGKPEKIIITGCMVGMAVRDKTGKLFRLIKKKMPLADEYLPIEEVGFDHDPVRTDSHKALVVISNGCNNFCTFCVVPFTRGREVSRNPDEILAECRMLAREGYKEITLLGMNVNSYGADLIMGKSNIIVKNRKTSGYFKTKYNLNMPIPLKQAVYVKSLGRKRIPTLFPWLLEKVSEIKGIEKISFLSSNPWDFSDELIELIGIKSNISKEVHLPVQSGSDRILKKMNRWYTAKEYLDLVRKMRKKIKNLKLTTDIIVGFCSETDEDFQKTYDLAQKASFAKAYIAMYSSRYNTAATKVYKDDVSYKVKKGRWLILDKLIYKGKNYADR